MPSIFETRILPELKAREGGAKYTNHPSDRGGPTKYGITAATLGRYRRLGRDATPAEVQALTEPEADAIYTGLYWTGPGYSRIEPYSVAIAEELMDTGVNMGTGLPGSWLQRSLNAMNRRGRLYPDLKVDNDIGGRTTDALRLLISADGKQQTEECILKLLNGLQTVRYLELCEGRSPNEDFIRGWLRHRVGL